MDNFKNQTESYLKKFLGAKIKEFKKNDLVAAELCGSVKSFTLNGGKRIRASLICYGYQIAGGKNITIAIKTAAAFELIHTFLLIHDDMIDRSNTRRHQDTIHIQYQKLYKKNLKINQDHFGNSMAVLAGDLAMSLAYEILGEVNQEINNPQIFKIINRIVQQTIIGETLDVVYSSITKSLSPAESAEHTVHKIHLLKTAKYTIEGPLSTGLILGGANQKTLSQFSKFSIPLGIAYQIKDDIEGVFGNEVETGKSITSDIREGKLTLLTTKAIKESNKKEKEFLKKILGNNTATNKDLETVKQIMIRTGALRYSQEKIATLTKKARQALRNIKLENNSFLEKLIEYIEK